MKAPWIFGLLVVGIALFVFVQIKPFLDRLAGGDNAVIHPPNPNLGQAVTNNFNRVHGIIPVPLLPPPADADDIAYEAGKDL